jgi:hypothetical protein
MALRKRIALQNPIMILYRIRLKFVWIKIFLLNSNLAFSVRTNMTFLPLPIFYRSVHPTRIKKTNSITKINIVRTAHGDWIRRKSSAKIWTTPYIMKINRTVFFLFCLAIVANMGCYSFSRNKKHLIVKSTYISDFEMNSDTLTVVVWKRNFFSLDTSNLYFFVKIDTTGRQRY